MQDFEDWRARARDPLDDPASEQLAPLAPWVLPERVAIEGDWLVYWPGERRTTGPGGGMLREFVDLAGAQLAAVERYAYRWGPLGLCKEHRLPHTHTAPSRFVAQQFGGLAAHREPCAPSVRLHGGGWQFSEPLSAWQSYARQARALLNIAARLHDGNPGERKDWKVLYEGFGVVPSARPRGIALVLWERARLALFVSIWLELGNVRPVLTWWDEAAWVLAGPGLPGFGLFPALAVQLSLAVSATRGFATCSACGVWYPTGRQPAAGRRRYCDKCRADKVPMREARRAYNRSPKGQEARARARERQLRSRIAKGVRTDGKPQG